MIAPGNYPAGIRDVQQNAAKTISVTFVSAVVDHEPSVRSPDRGAATADAGAVPFIFSGGSNTLVMAPMD